MNVSLRLCLYSLSDGSVHYFANSLCPDLVDAFHRENLAYGVRSGIVNAELEVIAEHARKKAEAS